ncbi:MAG: exodeoxyribonuclease VII large subunit [Rhodothermaceae bacterium]
MNTVLSVSELTNSVKLILEDSFESVKIIGEISNFKAHFSGHWYFTLKDENAQINCTMWKGINNYVFFTPQDGMKVVITGRITVYPPRGTYQLDCRSIKPAGVGELQAAYEKLKSDLSEEGLFDEENKKEIPKFPQKIGIVTAIDGAALRDMISVAERRYPLTELVVASSRVQGEGAAGEIVDGIESLNKAGDIDLIIAGRGGGSLEDLWCFNEEIVARAIFDSEVPVISAVGHEIDFTIADFVADLRAPTPSAAMELATPDINEIFAFIDDFSYTTTEKINEIISNNRVEIRNILNSYGFRSPADLIRNKAQFMDSLIYKIDSEIKIKIQTNRSKVEILKNKIEANDLTKILKKGFAIVKQKNSFVTRSEKLETGNPVTLQFYDGEVELDYGEKK